MPPSVLLPFFASRLSRLACLLAFIIPGTTWGSLTNSAGIETFRFNGFSNTANLTLQGDAGISSNRLHLHGPEFGQRGAAWISSKRFLADGFECTFQFQITNRTGNGGSGIAFVVQNNPTPMEGSGGPGIGYQGISNSLALEFDTRQDSATSDAPVPHIVWHSRRTLADGTEETNSVGLISLTHDGAPNFADGRPHRFHLRYKDGNLSLQWEPSTRPSSSVSIDLESYFDLTHGQAWVGFTGATNPDGSETHDLLEWSFTSYSALPVVQASPASRTNQLGTASHFQVQVTGANPLYFQWLHDNQVIPGATNSMFEISEVGFSNAGAYSVEVSNAFGRVVTTQAVLSVTSDGTRKWTFNDAGTDSSPALDDDGTIYYLVANTTDLGGRLIALRADGTKKWQYILESQGMHAPAIGPDKTIYVPGSDQNLYAINPNGTLKWEFPIGTGPTTSPAIGADGTIYLGASNFRLYAVRPNGTKKWDFLANNRIHSSPAIGSDGTIYFGSFDRRLYAVNPAGTQKWSYLTGHEIHTSPAIDSNGTIVVSSYDDKVYAINPNGTLKWSQGPGGGDCSPTIGPDGSVYIGRGYNITAFTPAGVLAWSFPTGDRVLSSPAITADGKLYFGSFDGKFYALGTNGAKLWESPAGSPIGASSPAIGPDGTIYVGTSGGSLIAFNATSPLSASSWPVFRGNLRRDGLVAPTGRPVFTEQPQDVTTGAGTNVVLSANAIGSIPLSYQWFRDGVTLTNEHNVTGADAKQLSISSIRLEQAGNYVLRVVNADGTSESRTSRVSVLPFYRPPGSIIWSFPALGEITEAPSLSIDGTIYFGAADNKLYAVSTNRTSNWTYQAGGRLTTPAIGSNGVIYVGVSSNPGVDTPLNTFLAINPNGTKRWEFTNAGAVVRPPAIGYDGTIYVPGYTGKMYALSPEGREIWSKQVGNHWSTAPVIAADGTVYFGGATRNLQTGTSVGHVYALYPDGSTKWHYTNSSSFASGFALGENGDVFIGSAGNDGKFFAFSPLGNVRWQFTSGASISSQPILAANNVYFTHYDGRIFSLTRTGAFRWSTNSAGPAAAGSDGVIYVPWDGDSGEAQLRALGSTGQEIWTTTFGTWGSTTSPTLTPEGIIYVGAGTNLYAVQASSGLEQGSWPLMQQNPQHTGNLQQHAVPAIVITNPATGSEFRPGDTILVQTRLINIASDVSRVDFYANNNLLGSRTNLPFSLSWSNVARGIYAIRAVAIDQLGNSVSSGEIEVTVNDLPFVELTTPASNSLFFSRDHVLLKANAYDIDGIARVEFYVGNSRLASVTNPPYSALWERVPAGTYQVWAKAFDNLGETSSSVKVTVRINGYPSVAINSPVNNSTFSIGTPVRLWAQASDISGTVANVQFYSGSQLLGSDDSALFTLDWLPQQPGQHTLIARAVDNDGAATLSFPITVKIVDFNPPPVIRLSAPINREIIKMPGLVNIAADIVDTNAQVVRTTLKANDLLLQSFDHGGSIAFKWQPTTAGDYTITIEAVNSRGQATRVSRQISILKPEDVIPEPVVPVSTTRTNLWVPDGPVHTLVETNGILYIGGAFQHIGQFVPGHGIVELSAAAPDLSHPGADVLVDAILDDRQGGYYVSGLFARIGGVPRRGIAHIKPDKSIDLEFQADANGHVLTMALDENTLYVGGEFDEIAGVNQRYIAALDARTGELKPWNPEPTGWISALFVTNSTVYVGGNFQYIGGAYRSHLAAVDVVTGLARDWNPSPDGIVSGLIGGNARLYVIGGFVNLNGEVRNGLGAFNLATGELDAFNSMGMQGARSLVEHEGIVYVGRSSGLLALNPITHANQLPSLQVNGSVESVAVLGEMIYFAGGFSRVNGVVRNRVAAVNRFTGEVSGLDLNPSGRFELVSRVGDKVLGAGTLGLIRVPRRGLAAIDITSGAATAWNPGCDGTVYSLAILSNQMFVGGQFANLGGQPRNSLGSVDLHSGNLSLWRPLTTPQSTTIYTMAALGETILAGGVFNQVNNIARGNLAEFVVRNGELTSWNPNANEAVHSIKVQNDTVYLGGAFTQVRGQLRNRLAAVNRFTGQPTAWNPNANRIVKAIEAGENEIYIAGAFSEVAGELRSSLAAIDKLTGKVTPWVADADGSVGALHKHGDVLFAAGQFSAINNVSATNAVALHTRVIPAHILDWSPSTGSEDSTSVVYALLAAQGSVFLGGRFQTSAGTPTPYLASFDEPSQFRNAFQLPDGLFRFNFYAPLGYYYLFESSSDLKTWTPILTNRAPFLFEDIIPLGNEMLFYRARPFR